MAQISIISIDLSSKYTFSASVGASREKTEDWTQQNDCLFNNVDFSIMSPLQTLYGKNLKLFKTILVNPDF